MAFVRATLEQARRHWPDRMVSEPDYPGNHRELYTETHYALAALLLGLLGSDDRGTGGDAQAGSWLDLAAERLSLWNHETAPRTFFNSMAFCLAAIELKRSGVTHERLGSVLRALLARTPRMHRREAFYQFCGNNAYLQQVAVDTVLLPLALGERVTSSDLAALTSEFARYRTPEGFFLDLPRRGTREAIVPPTYVLKMLFLAGICDELHPSSALGDLFLTGMAAVLPLLTSDGQFSYFGRTDNSPFAAGLTIFNLRRAARLSPARRHEYEAACVAAERFYETFPRTASGMLESNRFDRAESAAEQRRSRDYYAYVGQYSLASSAYALLGVRWFRAEHSTGEPPGSLPPAVATSDDLGVVHVRQKNAELIVRTRFDAMAGDRRYFGPTILRYRSADRLLVGAISHTVSTDPGVRSAGSRVGRGLNLFAGRFRRGFETTDPVSVGYLPVVRSGRFDYVPHHVRALKASAESVVSEHEIVRISARGFHPCWLEASAIFHRIVARGFRTLRTSTGRRFPARGVFAGALYRRVAWLRPREFNRPRIRRVETLRLTREIRLHETGCVIDDRLRGDLAGKRVLFAARSLPGAVVHVRGLTKLGADVGWGSDGRQAIDLYTTLADSSEVRYTCHIQAS